MAITTVISTVPKPSKKNTALGELVDSQSLLDIRAPNLLGDVEIPCKYLPTSIKPT